MHRYRTSALLLLASLGAVPLEAADADPRGVEFFEKKVRPVLVEHCYSCHSQTSGKSRGGLRVDTRDGLRNGGDTGPAVVPGQVKDSLLLEAVRYSREDLRMPPKAKLPEAVIADLTRWIEIGAPDPRDGKATTQVGREEEGRKHWAFQPLLKAALPAVKDASWPRNELDRFLLARLEALTLRPVGDAAPHLLVRRLHLDLLGLPPAPEEIEAFEKAAARDVQAALEERVDQLLSRPEYGERWARHWLDVARYADSSGFEGDRLKPFAWRYRDYVVDAFNRDKPFDRFLTEQLAGDEVDGADAESKIALTFLRLGTHDNNAGDKELHRYDQFDDVLSTVSQAFLGQTLGCARCHEHKFEPFSQRDYYRFLAVFRPLMPAGENNGLPVGGEAGPAPAVDKKDKQTGQLLAHIWLEKPGTIPATHVLKRGDPKQPLEEVAPGLPEVLFVQPGVPPQRTGSSSGRRLWLAQWMTGPAQALTARVFVNRLWQHHFGRGLVGTSNDLGLMGERPTHPELLDWLAADFIAHGWKVKRLQRLLVLSHAYRLAASPSPEAARVDPDNRLLWRWRARRLDAEAFRDSLLALSGKLDLQRGGPGQNANSNRRSIYLSVKRAGPVPELEIMDTPDTNFSTGSRNVSTTPLQALTWMNGKFAQEHAEQLADRLLKEAGKDPEPLVRRAFLRVLGRTPRPEELQASLAYLAGQRRGPQANVTSQQLAAFCLVLLNTNELAYLN